MIANDAMMKTAAEVQSQTLVEDIARILHLNRSGIPGD
jgi:hypothetical protein